MQRRTRALFAAAALGVVFATAACTDDSDGDDARDTTTTSTAERVTTTAPSTTRPSGPAQSPEAAAKGLFDAWMNADRNGASRFARPQPINELFSHPNTGDVEYADQGCAPQGGQFVCSWTYPGGVLQMTVEAVPGGGFVVDDIIYRVD